MFSKKIAIGATGLGLLAVGWYLFRPELLFINEKVNEGFPSVNAASMKPAELFSGKFHGVAHDTHGTASIFEVDGNRKVIRLTGFKTSNGPDVHLYLVAAPDAKDSGTVKSAGFIDLGKLKGNEGDQNYDIPADTDLSKYRAATVWCARFAVNFGTAPLMANAMAAGGPTRLAEGKFHGVAHDTQGAAALYQVDGGKRILRLTGFKTSNGPDVHVYLVAAPDAKDNGTVKTAGFVDLGKLKGNEGDQNYDVPADLDTNKYRAATIWCARFSVNFGTAPLIGK